MTDNEKLNDANPAVRLRARLEEALRRGNNNYGHIEVEADDLREILSSAALTPTDDEREALKQIVIHVSANTPGDLTSPFRRDLIVSKILAAGFRRSEEPEPSTGQVNDVLVLLEDAIDNIDYPGADTLEWIGKAKAHAATLARWARPEPQGEPSDAGVDDAWWKAQEAGQLPRTPGPSIRQAFKAGYRAALRAAGVGGVR